MTTRRIPSYFFYFTLPVLVILFNHFIAKVLLPVYREWTWIVTTLVYWSTLWIGITFLKYKIGVDFRSWWKFHEKPRRWTILSLLGGLLTLSLLFRYGNVLSKEAPAFVLVWMFYALVNPFFEESFWRGFVIDYPIQMKIGFKISYSVLFFTICRTWIYGVFTSNMISTPILAATFISGLIWGLHFRNTRSLSGAYAGHVLFDLTALTTYLYMDFIQL